MHLNFARISYNFDINSSFAIRLSTNFDINYSFNHIAIKPYVIIGIS